jgi:hypothetical protein
MGSFSSLSVLHSSSFGALVVISNSLQFLTPPLIASILHIRPQFTTPMRAKQAAPSSLVGRRGKRLSAPSKGDQADLGHDR